jgi:hypothetical protein
MRFSPMRLAVLVVRQLKWLLLLLWRSLSAQLVDIHFQVDTGNIAGLLRLATHTPQIT